MMYELLLYVSFILPAYLYSITRCCCGVSFTTCDDCFYDTWEVVVSGISGIVGCSEFNGTHQITVALSGGSVSCDGWIRMTNVGLCLQYDDINGLVNLSFGGFGSSSPCEAGALGQYAFYQMTGFSEPDDCEQESYELNLLASPFCSGWPSTMTITAV